MQSSSYRAISFSNEIYTIIFGGGGVWGRDFRVSHLRGQEQARTSWQRDALDPSALGPTSRAIMHPSVTWNIELPRGERTCAVTRVEILERINRTTLSSFLGPGRGESPLYVATKFVTYDCKRQIRLPKLPHFLSTSKKLYVTLTHNTWRPSTFS